MQYTAYAVHRFYSKHVTTSTQTKWAALRDSPFLVHGALRFLIGCNPIRKRPT
jgi:hypothetical protein